MRRPCRQSLFTQMVLKVDLNPADTRKDILTPHWENWAWHEGKSGSENFRRCHGHFSRRAGRCSAVSVLFKGALDFGATMAADGITLGKSTNGNGIDTVISGLVPGKHTVVTYHNEVRDHVSPAILDVFVGDGQKVKGLVSTYRARQMITKLPARFLEVEAVAGERCGDPFSAGKIQRESKSHHQWL